MDISTVLGVWAVAAALAVLFIRGATQGKGEAENNEQHEGQLQGAGNE